MDGNGRWAKKKLLPRLVGHNKGLESVRRIIAYCIKYNVKTLTLYAFSTENWKRPTKEVDGLIKLFSESISNESKKIHSNNIKLNFIGDTSTFTEALRLKIKEIEKKTFKNKKLLILCCPPVRISKSTSEYPFVYKPLLISFSVIFLIFFFLE